MDKKEKKSLPEPRTYTVEQIAAMLNIPVSRRIPATG